MKRPTTEQVEGDFTIREGALPPRLIALRQKLSQKAKREKRFRFYSLYGHVIDPQTLRAAWGQVRANGGSPGVDGVSIQDVEKQGVEGFLMELEQSLKARTYRPKAVRRVYIAKENGKLRALGIPTVRDRVVQAAVLLIVGVIFEADFEDCSYGFRPGRSAHDALKTIKERLAVGQTAIYDADLEGYFDSIPHDKLMRCVRMRIVDGGVLQLIKMWLEAPVEEAPKKNGEGPTIKRNDRGTPQGGVISPLLANIYLHWFDKVFMRTDGPAQWAKATLVRYADDFVVMARYMSPRIKNFIEEKIENWLGLKINREKTRIFNAQERGHTLDFLGYSFRYDRDLLGRNRRYWNLQPSRKSLARQRAKLRQITGPQQCFKPLPKLIDEINANLRGWSNYFKMGYPRKAFRDMNVYVLHRLVRHLKRRSQRGYRPPKDRSYYVHLQRMGLLRL